MNKERLRKMDKQISSELKTIKEWIKKTKAFDVIIFGSFVRGKNHPNDVDLCILIKDSDEKKTLELVDSLAQILKESKFKFQINILTQPQCPKLCIFLQHFLLHPDARRMNY